MVTKTVPSNGISSPFPQRTLRRDIKLDYFTYEGLLRNIALESMLYECFAKELIDNALDAEATQVTIRVMLNELQKQDSSVLEVESDQAFDNFRKVLTDFGAYTSTKFVKRPTRGIMGHALKVLEGAPYALAETLGRPAPSSPMSVRTSGMTYRVDVDLNRVKGTAKVGIAPIGKAPNRNTLISLRLPYDTRFDARRRVTERVRDLAIRYSIFNPGIEFRFETSDEKPMPLRIGKRCDSYKGLTSAHWYSLSDFSELVRDYAHSGKKEALADFLGIIRGFTSHERQRLIQERMRSRTIQETAASEKETRKLFDLLRRFSDPPKPELLGRLGKANLRKSLEQNADQFRNFRYEVYQGVYKGEAFESPYVIEAAMCYDWTRHGRIIVLGINHSPYFGASEILHQGEVEWKTDQGRVAKASTLSGMLEKYEVKDSEPILLVVHVICPNLKIRDKAKFRYDFEPLMKPLAQLLYGVIKKHPQTRLHKGKRSQARLWLVTELKRRLEILNEKGEIPPQEWTTQQGLFYKVRNVMGGEIGIERDSFIHALVEECRKLGGGDLALRDKLGIKAAVRAQLFFRGAEDAVSFEQIATLAGKGSDILLCEKEGVAEVLEQYARKTGVAIVNSRGFATDYVRQLLNLSEQIRGNIFLLTDLDAQGLLIAQKLDRFKRIGVDSEMIEFLKEKGYLKDDSPLWEEYKPLHKHLVSLKDAKQREQVERKRLEIDSLMVAVGSQRFWEAVKKRMDEVQARDLTRSFVMTQEDLIPEDLERSLRRIRDFLKRQSDPLVLSALKKYKNWSSGIPDNVADEEQKIRNRVKDRLSRDGKIRRMARGLREVTDSLEEENHQA
jgi:predicted CopG family antitoxin